MAKMRSGHLTWPAVLIGAVVLMIALIVYLGLNEGLDMRRPTGFNLTPPPLPDVKLPDSPRLPTG